MEIYFAYGSNMSSARLLERVSAARALGPARLEGWRLCCNKPGADGTGKANLVEDRTAVSWGVLYELGHDVWPKLDPFEPGYTRAQRAVLDDSGTTRSAHLYLWTSPSPELPVLRWYLDHLLAGAREHGLPREYLATLEALPIR